MSGKVREGKKAGTSCEKTSHGRFQQISGENRPRERVSRQISANKWGESTERACLTADFSKKWKRIERESASHGRDRTNPGLLWTEKNRRVPADYGRDIGKRQIK